MSGAVTVPISPGSSPCQHEPVLLQHSGLVCWKCEARLESLGQSWTELAQAWSRSTSGAVLAACATIERLRQAGWLVVVKAMPDGVPFLLADDDPRARLEVAHVAQASWQGGHRKGADRASLRRTIFAKPRGTGSTLADAVANLAEDILVWEERYPLTPEVPE